MRSSFSQLTTQGATLSLVGGGIAVSSGSGDSAKPGLIDIPADDEVDANNPLHGLPAVDMTMWKKFDAKLLDKKFADQVVIFLYFKKN